MAFENLFAVRGTSVAARAVEIGKRMVAAFAALSALASIGFLLFQPSRGDPGKHVLLEDGTRIAYECWAGGDGVIVGIHGSPGGRSDFAAIAGPLSEHYTVYAFEMPGFGRSSKRVRNYGYAAAADYLAEAVDILDLPSFSFLGFSWGGGVAISFAAEYPEHLARLVLLGAVGVPDGFHTGSYAVEVARYILAAPILLVYPGSLAPGVISFAERFGFWRGFLDGNTRANAERLARVEVPTLILHADNDTVVGANAARRHHELLAESRLVFYDGGHGDIYGNSNGLAERLRREMEATPVSRRGSSDG
jgi:pimeloyl-ACP methyl ester carboxylesterase